MSTAAKMSAPGVATVPQLSNRALNLLKKGAMVEVWVTCNPYTIQVGEVQKVKTHIILCSAHIALLKYFSGKWKRDLAGDTAGRVQVPFSKEPARLVVGWMIGGGGNNLGTPEVPYPRNDLPKLEILKRLGVHLEINSLVELIAKDIGAISPTLPTPKAPKNEIIKKNKLCYFCNKPGHINRDCLERKAIWVTKSKAETYVIRGTNQAVQPSGPNKSKPEPAAVKGVATKATSPAAQAETSGMYPRALNLQA